jgi:hypothetical protein
MGLHSFRQAVPGTTPAVGTGRHELAVVCSRCGREKLVRVDLSPSVKPSVANGSAYGGAANAGHSSPGGGL